MINNKKGLFFVPVLIALSMVLIAIVLLIIFAPRISEVTTPIFSFLEKWWWAIGLTLIGIFYHKQVRAILDAILRLVGIRV